MKKHGGISFYCKWLICLISLSSAIGALVSTEDKQGLLKTSLPSTARFVCYPNTISSSICRPTVQICEARNWESSDAANESELRERGGDVQYPKPLNPSDPFIEQRATGVNLKLTHCALHPPRDGRTAYNNAGPPGWDAMTPVKSRSRAHLWPKDFGGSGRYFKNIVGFFHEPNRAMTDIECKIGTAFEDLGLSDTDVIYYNVFVMYHESSSIKYPRRMIIYVNVKFSHRDSSTGAVVNSYRPWLAGYADNESSSKLSMLYDRTVEIKNLKRTVLPVGSSPTCSSTSSGSLWSLDFYPGMSLNQWPWRLHSSPGGPKAVSGPRGLELSSDSTQWSSNLWVHVTSTRTMKVSSGAAIRFRLAFYGTESSEVKLALGGGITLRWTNEGSDANWVTYESGFKYHGSSSIRDSNWRDVLIVYEKYRTKLFEQGSLKFDIARNNGDSVEAKFSLNVLDAYAKTEVDVSNVMIQENLGL